MFGCGTQYLQTALQCVFTILYTALKLTAEHRFVLCLLMCYNGSMGKKRRNRKKKNRVSIRRSFLTPFLLTLGMVSGTGICGILIWLWVVEPARPVDNSHFQLTWERVEGREKNKPDEQQSEEKIEEIKSTNDKYADVLGDTEYMIENNIYAKDAADPEQVTIAFAGDILFDENYAIMTHVVGNNNIANGITPELIAEMKRADIMMLNNEFPYSDRGEPLEEKQFTFRAKPAAVNYLKDLGVDIVSLANNHAYDYGEPAFLDTMRILEEAGIASVGAGNNLAQARRPVYYIINNMKIAIVSATQIERLDTPDTKGATDSSAGVFRCWNGDNLLETVREAKENSDFVIAYLHWGTENVEEIDWAQEKQAPEVAEAGADLIIGSHPHCLQKIDVVKGVPVIYSLGNFWFNSKQVDTGMVRVTLNEDGLRSFQFVPCRQSGCRTSLLQGEEKKQVLDYMRGLSAGVRIDEEGYVSW